MKGAEERSLAEQFKLKRLPINGQPFSAFRLLAEDLNLEPSG
jgi:hypothetical protein